MAKSKVVTKVYGPYDTNRKDGRKLTVYRKADGSTTSTLTSRHEKNEARKAAGKKPLPKGRKGGGVVVAHKPGVSKGNSSPSATTVVKAGKNIADGNRSRRK